MAVDVTVNISTAWRKDDRRPEFVAALTDAFHDDSSLPVIIGGVHIGNVRIVGFSLPVGADQHGADFHFTARLT